MNKDFKKLNIALTISFLLFVVPMVGLIARVIKPDNMLPGLLMVIGILAFYIILGILAVKKKRSVVYWVGLSVITSPIGPIVAYFMMLNADVLEPKEKNP